MEEVPTFSLAMASHVLFLRQLRGHHVSVSASEWDYQVDRFLPPRNWSIKASGNLRLLAADIVADYETGELQPYLVLGSYSTLVIGFLDISEDKFAVVAEIPIASDFTDNDSSAKLECLLTNGPTIITSFAGKILVVYPQYFGEINHGDQDDSHKYWSDNQAIQNSWVTYVINLNDLHMGTNLRILFAHDWRSTCTPEVVLGTSNVCMDSMSPQQLDYTLQRSQVDWAYIQLDLYSLGSSLSNMAQQYSDQPMKQSWVKIYQKSASLLCNELFPATLNPFSISCSRLVPADPPSLVSIVSKLDRQHPEGFPDIIIGTYDCKILKCRHGKMIADVSLENIPLSLCFAVVTEGQGVLLATLAGVEQKVIAFCCETLKQLQVWSSVANVVVGDFQLAGHDQILLVKSLASAEPKSFSVENCWDSMFITDFKKSGFVGLNDQQQELKFTEGFEGIHQKSRHVEAVARFLEVRIEAGKFQEKQLQLQMEKKEDLLKSSCQLMEEMIARPILASIEERSLLARNHSKSIMKGNGLHLAKIEHLYHGLQARTWLLVISVRSIAPRGLILDNATLLLTTVQGQIAGSTSTVRSLNAQDKSYKFVVAVPLRNFMAFASFPVVNIMLTAGLTCEDIVHHQATEISCHEHNPSYRKFGSGVEEKHMCLHTEWLGRICIDKNDLIRQFVPTGLRYIIREVGENQLFILRPRAENDPLKLPSEIKSVLSMEYCGKEYGDLEVMKRRTCELVTASTCPFGQATICIFKDAALVSLCAEDRELLSCMASLLIAHFGHQYDIVQSISCEDMLEYLFSFIGMFLGELALKGCNHKSNQSEPGQNPIVEEHLRNSELLTDQTCLHLIPFAHH